jgi:uncharacterized protein DUF4160
VSLLERSRSDVIPLSGPLTDAGEIPLAIVDLMPTVFDEAGVRVAFASNDCPEPPHVHAIVESREAKFWLVPVVELDENHGLTRAELRTATRLINDRRIDCLDRWWRHCPAPESRAG